MATKKKVSAAGIYTIIPSLVYMAYAKNTGGWSTSSVGAPAAVMRQRLFGTMGNLSYETGRDGRFRPCDHVQRVFTAYPIPDDIIYCQPMPNGWGYRTCAVSGLQRSNWGRFYSQYQSACVGLTLNAATIDWNGLSQQAISAMMPSFGGQNSLINSLIELRDFRRLAASLATKSQRWLTVLKAVVGYRNKRKPLSNLSSAYLAYSFAWKPLYNDLVSLVSTLVSFEQRYRELVAQANTDLQKHFSVLVSGTSFPEDVYYSSGDQGPQGGWIGPARPKTRHRVRRDACEGVLFKATLRYRYPLPPELTTAGGKARAFLDALGIAGDPAIVWNAIPWTFVIDWVVNVGRWLSQMRVDNIRFKTEIRDYCCSAVVTRNVVYEQQQARSIHSPDNVITYVWGPWVATDHCRARHYIRRRGLPNLLSAMQTSGLNWREFSLAGALLSANSKSRRR